MKIDVIVKLRKEMIIVHLHEILACSVDSKAGNSCAVSFTTYRHFIDNKMLRAGFSFLTLISGIVCHRKSETKAKQEEADKRHSCCAKKK